MEGLTPISSRDNQYLKLARSLEKGKARRESGCFLLEGVRLAEEALKAHWPLSYGLVSQEALEQPRLKSLVQQVLDQKTPLYAVPDNMLQQASATEHSQGLLLIAHLPQKPPTLAQEGDFLLIADRLADPGNLGAIMRSARAAGADALLLTPGCADPYSPKVVRASMGGVLNLPLMSFPRDEDLLAFVAKQKLRLLAAAPQGSCRYDQVDLRQPLAWLLGAEATGLSPFWLKAATEIVYLPMAQGAESLNVAAAAAVLLYATACQRGFPKA